MSDYNNLKLSFDSEKAEKLLTRTENLSGNMKKAIFDIVAFFLVIALFLFENGELIVKEQSIVTFLGNIAVLFILSMCFDNNYRIKGKIYGMQGDNYQNASKKLREITEAIDDKFVSLITTNLEVFKIRKEREDKGSVLYRVGIPVSQFDEKLKFLQRSELERLGYTKIQVAGIIKARKLKKSTLTTAILLSETEAKKGCDELKSGKRLDLEHNVKSVTTYLLSAILFAYFAIGLSQDLTWGSFGWFMIKVCFLAFRGIKSYFDAFIEMNTTSSERINSKCMLISLLKDMGDSESQA